MNSYRMKTQDLTGQAFNWAVATCEGKENAWVMYCLKGGALQYSTDWALSGPIIEREEISIAREFAEGCIEWAAWTPAPIRDDAEAFGYGPTPLIAAMRCFVASVLGDEVEVPEELK